MLLAGRRLLVVEDDLWILTDLQHMLERAGAETICTTSLSEGLEVMDRPLDAAVLDVRIGESLVFPIAKRLMDRGVPIVFHTAVSNFDFDGINQPQVKILSKPASEPLLLHSIKECVEG